MKRSSDEKDEEKEEKKNDDRGGGSDTEQYQASGMSGSSNSASRCARKMFENGRFASDILTKWRCWRLSFKTFYVKNDDLA